MSSPGSLIAAVQSFVARGYSHDFRMEGGALRDLTADRALDLQDLQVDASLRFETAPDAGDASNLYALTDRKHGTKGLLIDAFDLMGELGGPPPAHHLGQGQAVWRTDERDVPTRYGVRKVSKAEFEADPDRFVLRIGFPDFPPCPFGETFSMLGFDTAEQTYVWLATKILRDDRLVRVPYADSDVPDND